MRKNVFFRKCIAITVVIIMLVVPSLSYASMFLTPNIGNYGSMIGSSSGLDYGNLTGSNNLFDHGGLDSSYNKPDYNEYYANQNFNDIFGEIESMRDDNTSDTMDNSLEEINNLLQRIDTDLPISDTRVEIIEKATEIRDDNEESDITAIISNILINEAIAASPTDTTSDLLGSIKESLGNLIGGGLSFESLEPDVIVNDMVATTAGKLAGDDFKVKLSGKIYFAETDRNGKPTSDKWVVLVHGFMMNGQAIADSLGEMYLNRGINVLAPDLRLW